LANVAFQFGDPQVKPFDFLDGKKMNLSQKLDDPGSCLVHATHYGHRCRRGCCGPTGPVAIELGGAVRRGGAAYWSDPVWGYNTILNMGQHEIVEKLRLEFDREITSERQVVYILVEIGKLLEHGDAKGTYPTISFYRNWVAHTKLDRSAVADSLVQLFDDYITSNNTTASDKLKEIVSPLTLRQELKTFLAHHDLTFSCCENGVLWKRFVKYLAEIIDETPLHRALRKPYTKTNHVESITVSRRRNLNGTAMLTWKAKCHNPPRAGIETEIEVVLLPDIDQVALPFGARQN
jgi:hypothetical protein